MSTLPTGKDSPFMLMTPSNDPATMICNSGLSSQKYFSEDKTGGISAYIFHAVQDVPCMSFLCSFKDKVFLHQPTPCSGVR